MSLILNGTDGISDVDGSAATPAIRGTDTNTGIFFPAADTIAFSEGGVESMRINSSGNVGIGTTTPNKSSATAPVLTVANTASGTSTATLEIVGSQDGNAIVGDLVFYNASSFTNAIDAKISGLRSGGGGYGALSFYTLDNYSLDEAMRIDYSGNLLVGTTTAISGSAFSNVGTGANALTLNSSGTSGTYTTLGFYNQGSYQAQIYWQQSNDSFYVQNNTGGVYLSPNATSWTSNSDERLKENLVPIENGLSKVCSLRSVIGNFKSDENKKPTPFLIAQDVQAVLPEAISSSTIKGDETQTEYLGVAYTEVIPLLVASIKELKSTVDAQAARIAALEGAAV